MSEKKKAIGGLWLNQSKGGKKYMSGSINGQKIVMFKNDFKEEGSKAPDYKIFASEEREQAPVGATAQQIMNVLDKQITLPEIDPDEIPF